MAWICLDEGDNGPVRFLSLVVAALQTVDESIGRSIQHILQPGQLASTALAPAPADESPGVIALITALINDIIHVPAPVALVLDDCHVISQAPIHQAVQSMLEHQPQNLHLVVLTREDPPLALPRLRVRQVVSAPGAPGARPRLAGQEQGGSEALPQVRQGAPPGAPAGLRPAAT